MKNKNYSNQRTGWLLGLVVTLFLLAFSTNQSFSQASYSTDFNINATGWTGTIIRTTATTACGSPSMRRNLYSSAATGNMVSPSVGTSNGALATLTYKYKVANWSANTVGTPNPWGSFNVQYGATATGPWTTFQTINASNHIVSGTCTTATATFTPPAGALFIKWDAFWTAGDYYINFDDVAITQAAGSPCSGTPAPGNTVASSATVCNGSSVNLSLQNLTSGSGVSYVWQHSDDNATWTSFGGNTSTASFTMGAIPKYFQCIVTCGANSGTSASVLVGLNSFINCYCASNATITADTKIDSVQLGTLYVGSSPTACETYTNNTAIPAPVIYFNAPQTLRIRNGSCSGGHFGAFVAAFIDINQDGIYQDPAERVASFNPTTALNSVPLFNFSIPSGGPTGLTGMRIIIRESSAITACGTYSYGETEDYLVDLQNEPACIDPPTAGTALSNISQFCNTSTVNVNLSLNGNSIGLGQTYQWMESPDDVSYSPILGATSTTYTANGVAASTYFRCDVTCGLSTVPSTSVFVESIDPPFSGTISGPASVYVNQAASYTAGGGSSGSLQWIGRLLPATAWQVVPGGVNDPQSIFFGNPGTWEIRLVTSVSGCASDSSNIVSTVVTLQGDNVCDAVPVNIGVNGPFSNVGATVEAGEAQAPVGSCTGNANWCTVYSNTVWFTFTVPAGGSGRYGLGFSPGNWDSQVAIWSAATCGDLLNGTAILIAANDDSSGASPYNSYASAHCLTPGVTYYIQVDGYSSTTNSAFGLRIDDLGPADTAFSGLPAVMCENAASASLVGAVAGGTFSGTGVTGSSFSPTAAGVGPHTITYTLGGLDACYSSSQQVQVDAPTFTYYVDIDGDTYGNSESDILSCDAFAPVGYSADATDCDDNNPSVNPAATEICNSIDDNCDANVDEGFDVDGDGFTSCGGDCNDNDNTVYPGAAEVCNGVDDDCNLLVDDGLTFITYYADVDADGFGDASNSVSTCDGAPAGYTLNTTDCDDNNAAVNPAAVEICNTIDDDCNGLVDENVLVAGPISGPAVQCMAVVTGSATFSISPVFDATSYSWSVPNGMIIVSGQGSTSIFVSWAPLAVSSGIIGALTVTPSNSCGSGVSSSINVDINAVIPVRPSSISGPTKLCPGDNGVYSVSPVARASSYVWTVPAGMVITSGAGTNVITVDVNPGYLGGVVSSRAANACGIGPNRDRSVSVNVPSAPASISGQASGVCSATGVSYTAAAVVSATGYNWSVPAGATITSGQGSISITVDFDGSFGGGNIAVQGTNACGTGSTRNLSVTGAPGLPGVVTGDLTICPGQSGVQYDIATVAGASSYAWSLPGGTTITSGQGTKTILSTWGTNPATGLNLSVNASNGCGTSANRILNGISISVAHCTRIGDQGAITGLNLYPNPASDRATIVFNGTEGADFNLKMVDVIGRTIMTERGTATNGLNQREVNVSQMASGIYFIIIETNEAVEQIRMIVE